MLLLQTQLLNMQAHLTSHLNRTVHLVQPNLASPTLSRRLLGKRSDLHLLQPNLASPSSSRRMSPTSLASATCTTPGNAPQLHPVPADPIPAHCDRSSFTRAMCVEKLDTSPVHAPSSNSRRPHRVLVRRLVAVAHVMVTAVAERPRVPQNCKLQIPIQPPSAAWRVSRCQQWV